MDEWPIAVRVLVVVVVWFIGVVVIAAVWGFFANPGGRDQKEQKSL